MAWRCLGVFGFPPMSECASVEDGIVEDELRRAEEAALS